MTRRRLALPALALVVPAIVLAPAAASARGARACKPARLAFTRAPGEPRGVLRWSRPRVRGRRVVAYRVFRNGKVIGQTSTRTMVVAVKPGRRYRLAIRAIGRGGHPLRCRAELRRDEPFYPPAAPVGLTASDLKDDRVTLSWTPGPAGDGRLAGYRVYRDGASVRQLATTSLTVSLASARSFAFAVRAVDTRGHLSEPQSITVSTDHNPPSAPEGLRATSVGDAGITLEWSPARARSGRITGYRVFRDGVLLGQPTKPSFQAERLRSSSFYTFTVVAVDSFGYASTPSQALTVSTDPPEPTQGHAHAFLLASTDSSFEDFRAHYRQIGTVYPTYFECARPSGRILGKDNPQITAWAKVRQVQVLPRYDCQSPTTLHTILTDPTVRQTTLDELVGLTQRNGYDGINLDFEAGAWSDRAALTAFAADLAARLHAIGKQLAIDVSPKFRDDPRHPRSGFYDYAALSASADSIFIMCWGIHWATSAPGALADIQWQAKVAAYAATFPNRDRFVLGTPFYGFDWPAGGGAQHRATPYGHAAVLGLAATFGATPIWDPASAEAHFSYTDRAGVGHDVWYTTAQSIASRVQLAADKGLGGIGFWRLGQEDQGVWDTPLLAPGTPWPNAGA